MHSRRGLTFIELLAALALLGMLTAALAQWTQMTMRIASSAGRDLTWKRAASSALQRINDDLLIGDFASKEKSAPKDNVLRAQVIDDRLTIRTRQRGRSVLHAYQFDQSGGQLVRDSQYESGASQRRVLLGDVAAISFEQHVEERSLLIALTSTTGLRQIRRFSLP